MILGGDNRKMSKRWGNVVNPDDIVKIYGADTLRVYEMFMGPFDQMLPWSTESIIGSRRFLEKVWRIGQKVALSKVKETGKEAEIILQKTIKKVTEDIDNFSFNTAISAMMILANVLEKTDDINQKDFLKFLQILCPFAPHLTEELSSLLGQKKNIVKSSWPSWDQEKVKDDIVKIAVQINGKVRSEIEVGKEATEEAVKEIALSDLNVKKWLDNKDIKRFIYVPSRVVNIVV
jgi:leucyl-tRNA synthetase